MFNLIADLSCTTAVHKSTLEKIAQKAIYCICHDVEQNNKDITVIDTGIGTLSILVDGDNVKYKFIPSKKLEESINETIISGESPIIHELENAIKNKIACAYKELF